MKILDYTNRLIEEMFVLPPGPRTPKLSGGPSGGGTRGFKQAANSAPTAAKAKEAVKAPSATATTKPTSIGK